MNRDEEDEMSDRMSLQELRDPRPADVTYEIEDVFADRVDERFSMRAVDAGILLALAQQMVRCADEAIADVSEDRLGAELEARLRGKAEGFRLAAEAIRRAVR